jgi:hypothetical protein
MNFTLKSFFKEGLGKLTESSMRHQVNFNCKKRSKDSDFLFNSKNVLKSFKKLIKDLALS